MFDKHDHDAMAEEASSMMGSMLKKAWPFFVAQALVLILIVGLFVWTVVTVAEALS